MIDTVTKVWAIMLLNRKSITDLVEMAGLDPEVSEVQSVEMFVQNVTNVLREM